jgi:uncharacterized protein
MKLSASYSINAARDKVFSALTDPEVLKRCIEGCEKITRIAEDDYEALLKIGVAGLKGTYTGKVRIKDQKPPESYMLVIEGKGAASFVKGMAKVQLIDQSSQTELHCEADAQVGGMIAAIGSRLIEAAAKRMMDEFFRKLGEELAARR